MQLPRGRPFAVVRISAKTRGVDADACARAIAIPTAGRPPTIVYTVVHVPRAGAVLAIEAPLFVRTRQRACLVQVATALLRDPKKAGLFNGETTMWYAAHAAVSRSSTPRTRLLSMHVRPRTRPSSGMHARPSAPFSNRSACDSLHVLQTQ